MSSLRDGYRPLKEKPPVPPKPKETLQRMPSAPAVLGSTIFPTAVWSTGTDAGSSTSTVPMNHFQRSQSVSRGNSTSLASKASDAALARSYSLSAGSPKPLLLPPPSAGKPPPLPPSKVGKPLPPPPSQKSKSSIVSPVKLTTLSEEFVPLKSEPPRVPPQKPSDYLDFVPSNSATVRSNSSTKSSNFGSSSAASSPQDTAPSTHYKPQQPVTYATPPPREMDHVEREHPKNAFEYMDQMRKRGDLCDVTFVVDTAEIKAHKVVLSASSQYFESMFIGEFAEPEGEPIVIEEVEDDALIALVNFAYTSRIKLTDHNIYSIFEAADLLQFPGVKSACFKFFKQQINKSNCIRTWLFAESHNCTELMEASIKYIECNFLDIVRGREFLNLEQPDIVEKLAQLEDLAITSEEQVYEAVLGWLKHDPERRREHAATVFRHIRFPSMSRDYLMYIVDHESFIKEDPDCLQQLIDALESHVLSIRTTMRKKLLKQGRSSSTSTTPRPASMAVEVVKIYRENRILGLRIMGGSDRPTHVFRQGDKPGIFILKVTPEGAAASVGKLRSGDRILRVNDTDASDATHEQAIRLLTTSPDPLTLLVRHEPPPHGLNELTLVTKPGEGFGLAISGGVNGYPGNPMDETDEGIFISQIIPGGASEWDGRLSVGMRILQINSISMLGKTHEEALKVLQGVLDRMNLLVCHGYDPSALPPQTIGMEEGEGSGYESLYERTTIGMENGFLNSTSR